MIKKLHHEDIEKYSDFFETLSHLSEVVKLDKEKSRNILNKIDSQDGHIFVYIINDIIVSCVTLIIEQKFLRNGGKAGHIEDVVTHKGYEKRGYASELIQYALKFAKEQGCYKVVLYCKKELESFYTKNRFKTAGINMEVRL